MILQLLRKTLQVALVHAEVRELPAPTELRTTSLQIRYENVKRKRKSVERSEAKFEVVRMLVLEAEGKVQDKC